LKSKSFTTYRVTLYIHGAQKQSVTTCSSLSQTNVPSVESRQLLVVTNGQL